MNAFALTGEETLQSLLTGPTADRSDLLARLTDAIEHILTTQPEAMAQIAYRLDLDEVAFMHATRQALPGAALATLVLERQLKKLHTRRNTPPADESTMDDADLRW